MIRVVRPKIAPQALIDKRNDELPKLRDLINRKVSSKEIQEQIAGYKVVREELWNAQHSKCCYCEKGVEAPHNDVEHYRPKLEAIREPGSKETYGYWWLAYTWENLLFACSNCNRSAKGTHFPLEHGSKPLAPEAPPPGDEKPLALDPADARINPVEHIEFYFGSRFVGEDLKWYAQARNNSQQGLWSIEKVYRLNRSALVKLRTDHVRDHVQPLAKRLLRQLREPNLTEAKHSFDEAMALLRPEVTYVALTYDALRHYVKDEDLLPLDRRWPKPKNVPLSNAQSPIRRPAGSAPR